MSIIQVNAEQPVPIWTIVAQVPGVSILIINQDIAANITIGGADVTAGATGSAGIIPPQGALSLPANNSWYAISDIDDGATLQVTLGGADWTPGAAGIAQAMISAGIPTLIAQELSASGVSLLAASNQLYNIGGVPTPGSGGSTSLVGWSVPNQCYKPGCYYQSFAGPNQMETGDAAFQALVQRGLSNNKPPIVKKFWNQGDYHLTSNFNNMDNYAADGTTVVVCIWPNFTTTGGVTTVPASEITAISGFCTALIGKGYSGSNCIFVVIQEPEVFVNHVVKATPAQFQAVLTQVGPTITGAGFGIVPDIGSGAGAATAVSYANAAIASGITFAGLASDFYYPVFNNSGTAVLTAMAAVADANLLPYGLFEFGIAPQNFPSNPNASAQYFGAIQSFFQARQVAANKKNLHFIWYDGQCSPTGAGDLTAPILVAGDPRITLFQKLFDNLTTSTVSSSNGLSIAATHTTTLTPTNPSPVGGLAAIEELSYEIAFGLTAGAASTLPFAHVILTFYEFDQLPKNQIQVDQIGFFVPMGTNADPNGPLLVYGKGRMRGSFMTVKVNNFDSVACTLQYLQLMDTSRPPTRDDWRYDTNSANSPNVPGFTLASAASAALEVGRVTGQTVLHAGGVKSWLCGLFAGEVYHTFSVPTGSTGNNVQFQVQPQPTNIFTGSPSYDTVALGAAGNTRDVGYFSLPRAPVLITVTNNEAANDVTVSFALVAKETG